MDILSLDVPKITREPVPEHIADSGKFASWIGALDNPDHQRTIDEMIDKLSIINRAHITPLLRLQRTSELNKPAISSTTLSRIEYSHSAFPLPANLQDMANKNKRLYSEMATSYKIIVSDLTSSTDISTNDMDTLIKAVYFSIYFLSLQIVEDYVIYGSESKHTWSEIHMLYGFSKHYGFHTSEISPGQKQPLMEGVIEGAYCRILLLSLSNPYHLLQGEVIDIFNKLLEWSPLCRITQRDQFTHPRGGHHLDIANSHTLDVSPLIKLLSSNILESGAHDQNKPANLLLDKQYQQRNLYKRLLDSWGASRTRATPRSPNTIDTQFAIGVTSCHELFSAPATRTAEIRMFNGQQKDQNQGGVAVSCLIQDDLKLRVGDLIALKHNTGITSHRSLGALSWLRIGNKQTIEFGVRRLATDARAVTVTAVDAPSDASKTFPGLIVPAVDPRTDHATLIIPAAFGDHTMRLMLDSSLDQIHIRLDKVLESSPGYVRFRFGVIG